MGSHIYMAYVRPGDLNSDPHACMANALSIESSLQLLSGPTRLEDETPFFSFLLFLRQTLCYASQDGLGLVVMLSVSGVKKLASL